MNKQSILYLGIGLFLTVVLVGVILYLTGKESTFESPFSLSKLAQEDTNILDEKEEIEMSTVQDFDEFKIETMKDGQGLGAENGNTVVVNYEGTLADGTKFDSSYDRGTPFEFVLGAGFVIAGWDEGLLGMKVGEMRQLTIPSSKGYGSSGAGEVIPPNAGLIFKVELLEIK